MLLPVLFQIRGNKSDLDVSFYQSNRLLVMSMYAFSSLYSNHEKLSALSERRIPLGAKLWNNCGY